MKKYNVIVKEVLLKNVEVEASSEEEAEEIVREMWENEEIVLDSGDFKEDVEIKAEEDSDDIEHCPHCSVVLEVKVVDVDGTNLEEHLICPSCGYGTPALR